MKLKHVVQTLLLFLVGILPLCGNTFAAKPDLEKEIATLVEALSPSTPQSDGKGSSLLGSYADGDKLVVKVRIEMDGEWQGNWKRRVCTDPSMKKLFSLGGGVSIRAVDNRGKALGVISIRLADCENNR